MGFNFNKYDKQHDRNLTKYVKKMEDIYAAAAKEAAGMSSLVKGLSPDKMFSFDDYPATKKRIEKLLEELHSSITTAIVNGVRAEWALANNKNNELSNWVFGRKADELSDETKKRYFGKNSAALEAFEKRTQNGLNLSDRVWKYTDMFKEEIEMGLDIGIRDGVSAAEMTRDLKKYLQHPDMLFRRVRDAHGNLVLSQRAKTYHPGRGVYRSSYMNARRLAATETNIAYRTADHLRWKDMDFVVGIEVKLSNNHNCKGIPVGQFADICDELAGKYPKSFKFTGWHPHCRCHAEPILKSEEEMDRDTERILNGKEPLKESENTVEDVPKGFEGWVKKNQDRIEGAKTLPYWINDNKESVNKMLKAEAKGGALIPVLDEIKVNGKIDYLPVARFKTQPSEQQIIERLGGGDRTQGSCSSLAFAYAANKGGIDVLDYRCGESRRFFMSDKNICDIMEKVGGYYGFGKKSGMELLKEYAEIGKEYYLGIGRHVAIVRKIADKKFEYLELQTETRNGWHKLDVSVFKWRFAASGRKSWGEMVEISKLYNDSSYAELMGYINTAAEKQLKGNGGSAK